MGPWGNQASRAVLIIFALGASLPHARADAPVDQADLSQAACTTQRLDTPGGPLANEVVRDQGRSGSCQSHAAALLLNAYLTRRHAVDPSTPAPPAFEVSPWQIYSSRLVAEHYTLVHEDSGGNPIDAVLNGVFGANHGTVCNGRNLPFDRRQVDRAIMGLAETKNRLAQITDFGPSGAAQVAGIERQAYCTLMQNLGLPEGVVQASEVAGALENDQHARLLNSIVTHYCSQPANQLRIAPRPRLDMLDVHGSHPPSRQAFRDHIDEALAAGLPTAITYCSAFLHRDPPAIIDARTVAGQVSSYMHAHAGMSAVRAIDELCASHVSVITGRAWRNGRCMYLVHNSWGTDCNVYADPPLVPGGPPRPNIRSTRDCENGKIWIDEQELANVKTTFTLH